MNRRIFILAVLVGLLGAVEMAAKEHTVDRGETLESIARMYSVTPQAIIDANPGIGDMFFAGLVLQIPESNGANDNKDNYSDGDYQITSEEWKVENYADGNSYESEPIHVYEKSIDSKNEDPFESDRKFLTYEIFFTGSDFEYVKETGHYGIALTCLPWKLASRVYGGFHFSPANFNFGLVPSSMTYDLIAFGPTVGVYITPKIFISIPLDVLCNVYFDSNSNTKATWGLSLAPSIYLGSSVGIFVGPQFSVGFSSGSKFQCGFRAGIYF